MPKPAEVSADLVAAEFAPDSFEPDLELAHVVGTTWWKGASSMAPSIGQPPPDITLLCLDDDKVMPEGDDAEDDPLRVKAPRVEVVITWSMSWSDVLDLLRYQFGRAVYFEYADSNDIMIAVADEREFDKFCSEAEAGGLRVEVDIKNATMRPSEWIWDAPKVLDSHPHNLSGLAADSLPTADVDGWTAGMPEDEKGALSEAAEGEEGTTRSGMLARISRMLHDAPRPPEQIAVFGGGGLMLSSCLVLYLYMFGNVNSVAAVTISLPCNIFFISLLVCEVEEGFAPLFKLGVAFAGFWLGAVIVLPCLLLAAEYTAVTALPLWLISCFWYMELMVRALGWPNWLTGVYNLVAWILGGCGLPGIRKKEPKERITIIGLPPQPTAMTALLSLEQRHPGADWLDVNKAVDKKVIHVGKVIGPTAELSKMSGQPMGPFNEGIMEKKLSRQLKKWIERIGKKDDKYLKMQGEQGVGRISTISALGTKVKWLNPPKFCPEVGYFHTGEDSCGIYELLLFEEEDDLARENAFEDGDMIHGGGSTQERLTAFFTFFVPQVTKFLAGWMMFLAYFGMLYFFQISVTAYSITLAQGQQYSMPGRLYNAEPGDRQLLHIQCKGFTKNSIGNEIIPEDGRPTVIIESLEALGMASAMQRLQDAIAENGVCCVYDRIGYGWSTATETRRMPWTNRTPSAIAAELHYALVDGRDVLFKRGIFWEKEIIGYNNKTTISEVQIQPPFVLVAHSAGSLYARQFAHDYPDDVAGLVLVDALPAINNEDGVVKSPIHYQLPQFTLTMCHRYLQPMGMVNNLFSSIVLSMFTDKTQFAMQGGLPVNGTVLYQDFNIMTYFMFRRAWCPIVAAEYNGLFNSPGRGIETVAAADRLGYDMPVVLWAREVNSLQGTESMAQIYEYDVPETDGATAAARRWVQNALKDTNRPNFAASRSRSRRKSCAKTESDSMAEGGTGDAAAEGAAGETKAEGGCLTWFEVQMALQGSFRNSWTNPHSKKREVMRGDVESCLINGCTEYTSLENPAEVLDALLDLWWDLGYSTPTPSNIWYIELGGRSSTFNEESFKQDLSTLLSHVRPDEIRIVEPPAEGLAPQSKWEDTRRRHYAAEDAHPPGDRRAKTSGSGALHGPTVRAEDGKNWYSGPADPEGASVYLPIKNDGAYHFGVQLLGHKKRSTIWAQNILRGTEDVNLDNTATIRRGIFMRKYRVLSIRERICIPREPAEGVSAGGNSTNSTQPTQGADAARRQQVQQPTNQSNATTSTSGDEMIDASMACTYSAVDIFTSTYAAPIYGCPQNTYRLFFGCVLCSSAATSPTASLSVSSCQACASSRHLTCDGLACQDCPQGYVSNVGSLLIGECQPFGSWIFRLKGPIDEGKTTQDLTGHRQGLAPHTTFNLARFLSAVAQATGSKVQHISHTTPTPMTQFPPSRAENLAGATIFELELTFAVNGTNDADRITNSLLGRDEPEQADMKQEARKELFSEFQMLSISSLTEAGRVEGVCPFKYVKETDVTTRAPIFDSSYLTPRYRCPSFFYGDVDQCLPCPDKSASDPGATSLYQCVGFSTIIFSMKDPSVTYSARTNSNFGAAAEAQPNALDMMNYTDMKQSASLYSKFRGYALQPQQSRDLLNPNLGIEVDLCLQGSNCFNSSQFRHDLSQALNGKVQPNEVRLLPPQDCDAELTGLETACGLWPRYARHQDSNECVCSRPTHVPSPIDLKFARYYTGQQCYWTLGAPYIGLDVGLKVDSIGQLELASTRAATPADCADLCTETEGCHAFLYHHTLFTCELRTGVGLGQFADIHNCPSSSPTCIDKVKKVSFDTRGLIPGMQMYFLIVLPSNDPENQPNPKSIAPERYRKCHTISSQARACRSGDADSTNRVFDVLVDPIVNARGGTGRHSPSDSFFAIVRLQADTATPLQHALDIIKSGQASSHAPPGGEYSEFLEKYRVIQIFQSTDKRILQPSIFEPGPDGKPKPFVRAERDLMEAQHLLCGVSGDSQGLCRENLIRSSAWCDTSQDASNVAHCAGSIRRKPLCKKMWNDFEEAWISEIVCADGTDPLCSRGGTPKCEHANRLFDGDENSVWPVSKFQDEVESEFVTVSFSKDAVLLHVDFMEITRIEVQERQEVETGEADSIGVLEVVFSDGATTHLHLAGHVPVVTAQQARQLPPPARGSAKLQVFYIEPAVSNSLTLRVPRLTFEESKRNPQRNLGLRTLRVWGQPLSSSWKGLLVPLNAPGYLGAKAMQVDGKDIPRCPATTFFSRIQRSCVPCPYPLFSPQDTISAVEITSDDEPTPEAIRNEILNEPSCICPLCGDGRVQWEADEKCDDGNNVSSDGCDSSCKVEPLYLCTGPPRPNKFGDPSLSYQTPDSCIRIGSAWIPYGQHRFPGGARFGSASVLHLGAMWVIGGIGSGYASQFSQAIAEATNGENCLPFQPTDSCVKESGSALEWVVASSESETPWSARGYMGAVVFQDRIYIVGGAQGECNNLVCSLSLTKGDVWQSAAVPNVIEGGSSLSATIAWSVVTYEAQWVSRARAAVIVYKDRIWLLGGQTIEGSVDNRVSKMYNDVWASHDGANWELILPAAPWPPRCGHSVALFPHHNVEAVYILAGTDLSTYFNDVWASTDGVIWTQITAAAGFGGRWLHSSVAFRNNLWVLGGHACAAPPGTQQPEAYVCTETNQNPGVFFNDVWYSEDGAYWRMSIEHASWSPRAGMSALVFSQTQRTSLWVIGGYNGFSQALNDSYSAFTF